MNHQQIEQYAAGADTVAQAIRGLSRQEFLATPVPGTWSILQIVVHFMDSDLIGADRMKRIIAEHNPTLIGYDETAFSQRLFPERLDPFQAAEVFRLNRELTAVILRSLPESAFNRTGQHSERGQVTLSSMIQNYVEHLEHHLRFIEKKRSLLGNPGADHTGQSAR
ncbi:MAG: DinB family protein [Planctomycetes bacterium]|nr:DinB family protein [Planctomycetota bacterium]